MAQSLGEISNYVGGSVGGLAQDALQRWLLQQRQATKQFGAAEQPLQQAVQMFQPGGGYGAGQVALLEREARQAQARALSEQVASGMSSGSLATSTGLRVASDLARGKLGVEDTRTQFLNQALQALSGLRGGQAQTTASLVDPTYAPLMGYMSGEQQSSAQLAGQRIQSQTEIQAQQMRNDLALALAKMKSEENQGTYSTLQF